MSTASRPAPLTHDQYQLLAHIAHHGVLTGQADGRWMTRPGALQQRIEALGARALLTTEPVAPGVRRWTLARHGVATHRPGCDRCVLAQRIRIAA